MKYHPEIGAQMRGWAIMGHHMKWEAGEDVRSEGLWFHVEEAHTEPNGARSYVATRIAAPARTSDRLVDAFTELDRDPEADTRSAIVAIAHVLADGIDALSERLDRAFPNDPA
jgi:hypothetical protein